MLIYLFCSFTAPVYTTVTVQTTEEGKLSLFIRHRHLPVVLLKLYPTGITGTAPTTACLSNSAAFSSVVSQIMHQRI